MRYSTIKGSFSQNRRIPLLGRIRLGLKIQYGVDKQTGEPLMRPTETDYFVVPPEVQAVYGEQPKELDVMLPSDRAEDIFPQQLSWFGRSTGLKCTGNMEEAQRLNDKTGVWETRVCPCEHLKTDENPKGECTEAGTLVVLLPAVSMGGTYQIRTGSYHSVVDVNSGLDFVRALVGRISLVPLKLRRVARETHNNGKRQVHYTLSLTLDANVAGVNALREDTKRVMETARLIQIEGPKAIDPEDDGLPADRVDVDEEAPEAVNAAALEAGKQKLAEKRGQPVTRSLTMEGGAVHDPANHGVTTEPIGPESRHAAPVAVLEEAPLRIIADREFAVPEGQLMRDAFGQQLLAKVRKEWKLTAGAYPQQPEDRAQLLESLWEQVREQLNEAKRKG